MAGRARAALVAALVTASLATACGGEDAGPVAGAPHDGAGVGGTLAWAVAGPVRSLDPLAARSRSELILSRQIHEPLVDRVRAPFGEGRGRPGLARRLRPSDGGRVWTAVLRQGVRFADGAPLDAAAALANASRWQASATGAELLPGLVAADAPSPSTVRFILSAPDERLPRRLADPRLGLVSPKAIAAGLEAGGSLRRTPAGSGTGAFELREARADELLLARNTGWWGLAEGLGPALEQVVLRIEPSGSVRAALLGAGDVQLADELAGEQARFVRRDPLLGALRGRGAWLGLERSVRGIGSATEIPYLQRVWLTTLPSMR